MFIENGNIRNSMFLSFCDDERHGGAVGYLTGVPFVIFREPEGGAVGWFY